MGHATMPVHPAINRGEAPRYFGTSWEEVRLKDGTSEFYVYFDAGSRRLEICVITMPTAVTRAAEMVCARMACDKRVRPLES